MTVAVNRTTEGGQDGSIIKCIWVLTTADPKGVAVSLPEWSDMTWHASGTVGASTLSIETAPANTDALFAACKNAAGGAVIAITALPAVATSIESSLWVRPNLSVPGSGATVTVTLIARRGNPMRT